MKKIPALVLVLAALLFIAVGSQLIADTAPVERYLREITPNFPTGYRIQDGKVFAEHSDYYTGEWKETLAELPGADPETIRIVVEDERDHSGIFLLDKEHVFYPKYVMHGWREVAISPLGDLSSGRQERMTDVELMYMQIPNADPKTFVIKSFDSSSAKSVGESSVITYEAEDKNQTYTFRQVMWPCLGDANGCYGESELIITPK